MKNCFLPLPGCLDTTTLKRGALLLAVGALLPGQSAQAGTYDWNSVSSPVSWSSAANWTGSPPTGGPSAAGDVVTINTNIGAGINLSLFNTGDAGTAAKTIGILNLGDSNNTHNFAIAAGTGGGSLVLNNNGSGAQINELSTSKGDVISAGVQISDAGGLTVSNASGNNFGMSGGITSSGSGMNLVLNANGAGALTLSTNSVNHQGTITNSGSGTGKTTISAIISANVTGIIQNSADSELGLTGNNAFYSGGITIKQGTVSSVSGNPAGITEFGTGTITLGDTTGTASATLKTVSNARTLANAIVLATNPTAGALTIQNSAPNNAGLTTYSGGVTGTNNLVIANNSTGGTGLGFSTAAINNTGTVTNAGSGTAGATISGGIGANVTGIIQNSTTSALLINTTAVTMNASGTTLTNTSGGAKLTASGGTTGTGALVLKNNSTLADGLTLSGTTVNHTGTITNSGTGTGNSLISAVIGTNVTGVIQDSATSTLTLSGTNTFTSGITIKQGTLQLGNTSAANAGTINLGDSGTTAATLMLTIANTHNATSLVLGNSGTLAIVNNTNNNSTFAGVVTGTNNLALNNNNAGGGALSMSGLINNTGSISNNGTAANLLLITGGIGSNVTGVAHNSLTSATTINSGLAVNSGGTTLTNTSGGAKLTASSGITGTGNLVLNNNSSLAAGVTVSGSVNHTGTITNSGSGSGDSLISGVIGTNVTGVTQNSATSTLTLSANNTFTNALSITAGTLALTSGNINTSSGVSISGASSKLRYNSTTALNRSVTLTNGGTLAYNSAANYSGALTFTHGKLAGTNWNGTSLGGRTIGANQTISPGNSPGTATTTSQTWAGGGSYDWEINNTAGTAGSDPGWDLVNFSTGLTITATAGDKFTINVLSLTLANAAGAATGFDSDIGYNWLIADSASALTSFSASFFAINTAGFTNAFAGSFGLALGDTPGIGGDNTQLYLTYAPAIPEPSTAALIGGALALLAAAGRRRRT